MKEIEFRAYHKKKRRMFFVEKMEYLTYDSDGFQLTLVKHGFNGGDTRPYQEEIDCHISDIHLMQYIGIKDKNGEKIFEGDIIKHKSGKIGEIKYDVESISFQTEKSNYVFDQEIGIKGEEMEVVGNIYQHKSLLKNEEIK